MKLLITFLTLTFSLSFNQVFSQTENKTADSLSLKIFLNNNSKIVRVEEIKGKTDTINYRFANGNKKVPLLKLKEQAACLGCPPKKSRKEDRQFY